MEQSSPHSYEFDGFRLDARSHVLYRAGEPLHVPRKAVELLVLLVGRGGEVVGKESLFAALWPDAVVEEANLTQTVYVLRKALGERPNQTQYVETIPRVGYRFTAAATAYEAPPARHGNGRRPPAPDASGASAATVANEAKPDTNQAAPGANGVATSELVTTEAEANEDAANEVAPSSFAEGDAPAEAARGGSLASPRLVVALSLCVPLAFALVWVSARKGAKRSAGAVESVAILPFRTVGAGPQGDEHLGLGMTDTLITRLSRLKQVSVRPTSAVMKYSGAGGDPRAAGRELGVDAVMDGTVQREGNQVRVTVRLIRTDGGQPIWAEKFDEPFTNVFALQDGISERVVGELRLKLSGAQWRGLTKQHTTSPAAYRAYAEGLFFWSKRTPEAMRKAVECFEQAAALDPDYALAFAALSDAYYLAGHFNFDFVPRETAFERATSAARRALALDETLAESHLAAAMVAQLNEDGPAAAEAHFRRAVELNPYHATVRQRYGWLLLMAGRLEEGVAEMRRGCELDPVSPVNTAAFSSALVFARQYDEAIKVTRRMLELEPNAVSIRFNLALAYAHKGLFDESVAELKRLGEVNRNGHAPQEALAIVYAQAGRREEAERLLRELRRMARDEDGSVSAYNVALAYAALGRRDDAFAWLESAAPAQLRGMSHHFMYDPHLDPLRADPRFQSFLDRHGRVLNGSEKD